MARLTNIQHRRDTAANWTSVNPTLASGEIGFETDTLKFKIGNGSSAWSALAYQGLQGITGAQGSIGAQGTQGLQGSQGTTGSQGVTGTQGLTGLQGVTGSQGLTGTQGAIGTQGTTGLQGTTGAQGTTGLQGTTGTQGTQGISGASILGLDNTFTGQIISTRANSATTGGGQLYLNGASGNRIDYSIAGVAAPAFTTRSAGTKIVLYPSLSASAADFAIGIENATLWQSVAASTEFFRWYAGTTNVATLTGGGALSLTSTISASGLAGSLLTSTVGTALGTAAAGTATVPARADHVHPTTGVALNNQTMYVGTTALAINRASAAQTLTGTSIDGVSASATAARGMGQWDGTTFLQGASPMAASGSRSTSFNPNAYSQGIFFEFKNTVFGIPAGNYGGLITVAPWDSTSASTGDSSYQLMLSPAATNSTATPNFRMRAGIDTTWGPWVNILHTGGGQTISGSLSLTGLIVGKENTGGTILNSNDSGSISIRGNATTQAAAMSFHRTGNYAINMGLDTDNVFKIGGWSSGIIMMSLNGSGNLTVPGNVTAASLTGYITGTNHGRTGPGVIFQPAAGSQATYSGYPVGYSAMLIPSANGMPNSSHYFYLNKVAQRDGAGGWAGIAINFNTGDLYVGNTQDGANYATWKRLANEILMGTAAPSGGVDGDVYVQYTA
jgi:hypothetical protein